MKIIYVHHGQRCFNMEKGQSDDLTELGVQDCETTRELIEGSPFLGNIKVVYTSPFLRCKKTAEIINHNLNLKVVEDSRLDEFGSFKGENWLDCQSRIIDFLEDIMQKYEKDDAVICVTSGVNLGAFMCKVFNLKPSKNTPFLGVPSCSPIVFEVD